MKSIELNDILNAPPNDETKSIILSQLQASENFNGKFPKEFLSLKEEGDLKKP